MRAWNRSKKLAKPKEKIRGPGWSAAPMGFNIGIIITGGNLQGGTQDTDFNKGFIGRRNRGGQGHSDPLIKKLTKPWEKQQKHSQV